MEIRLFEADNGECPYLQNKQWICHLLHSCYLGSENYEMLINQGFRRNGMHFYRNNCHNCTQCISLRVPVNSFSPSRSQKRVWRKNQDLQVQSARVSFDEECYQLYLRYSQIKHNQLTTREEYKQFLIDTAVDTIMMKYYLNDQLLAVSWVDLLPNSMSSVYFAFDPNFSKRSLGIFSILKEIEICQLSHKKFLHLGFWIEGNQKMNYKGDFEPHQILVENRWIENKKRK
ncbi:MAG: arginyltransferase [Proteobacteria bacterium]|nr:arginyltransferase [Pseudomonadota bacterium]